LGISRASLANIETGRQNVMIHQLFTFARVLELPPSDFLPAVDGDSEVEWGELLPENLKPQQKNQIVRLLSGTQADSTQAKEGTRAKQTKG
jgi:transcriptional regulator with XRE-family HTH domain